jgi:hypothetical protein
MEDDASNEVVNEVLDNANVDDTAESLDSLNEISSESQNDFQRQFAALSRKDKENREERQSWESKKLEMEAELQQYRDAQEAQEPEKEALPLEYRLKRNPIQTLEEMGLDFETLSNLVLNDGKLNSDMRSNNLREDIRSDYESKIAELTERLDTKEAAEEESSVQNAVTNFNNEITSFIDENPEEFELIKSTEASDLVYQTIEQHYQDTNEILEIEDAAKAVEDHLSAEAEKILGTKKYADRLKSALEPKSYRQEPITLSNEHSVSSSSATDPKLSADESKLAAAQLLKWDA